MKKAVAEVFEHCHTLSHVCSLLTWRCDLYAGQCRLGLEQEAEKKQEHHGANLGSSS